MVRGPRKGPPRPYPADHSQTLFLRGLPSQHLHKRSGMDRNDAGYSQMGAEGAQWQGTAHFTDEAHQFINLGDGTYFHSGLLAIRQGVASGVNMTYKILYNDAVAMTGGQKVDGPLSPQHVVRQMHAEGVTPIVLVTDEPEIYRPSELPPGTTVRHRDELDAVQREMREVKGCSGIVFVQTCAAARSFQTRLYQP